LGRGYYEPQQTAEAAQLDRDLALVLDRSSSMDSDDKFEGLQNAVSVFLAEIANTPQTEHVSITVYDRNADKVIDLTPDVVAAEDAFSAVETGSGTAIGRGLEMGIDSLLNDVQRRPFADATIVLMTDGRHNTGIDPEDAIVNAPLNFTVHTITFGSGAEQDRMADLAASRNGEHFHAPDNQTLIDIFRDIAASLPVVLTE
jgi:Mg-chelatase subunit ChlD